MQKVAIRIEYDPARIAADFCRVQIGALQAAIRVRFAVTWYDANLSGLATPCFDAIRLARDLTALTKRITRSIATVRAGLHLNADAVLQPLTWIISALAILTLLA